MGQLQNAFNAGVGSIIASKAMAEHLQSQALNNIQSQYAEAKNIGKEAEEIAKNINEQSDIEQAAEDFKKESLKKLEIKHPRDEKTGRFVNKKEYQRKLDMDLDEAEKALFDVHKQQNATAAQAQAFQARKDFYNKRQDILQTSLNRLPAKKRPEQADLNKIISQKQWDAIDLITQTVKIDDLNKRNQAYKNNKENK